MGFASQLRRFARFAGVVACVAATSSAPTRAADELESPYFCGRYSWATRVDRIAPGPGGTLCIAGLTGDPEIAGAVNAPDDPRDYSGFVAVLETDGRTRWLRYLGRNWDRIGDVRVAPDGSVWVAENFESFVATRNDVRVTRLGADGAPIGAVDLVGNSDELATGIAIAPNGDAIVVGTTNSADFPIVDGSQGQIGGGTDGFVARIRADGIVWSSFLGGPGDEDANAVAVDAGGDVLVTTRVRSFASDYYPVESADASTGVKSVDLLRLSGEGALRSSLALPSGDSGGAFAIAVDADGRILVGGAIGFADRGPAERYVLPIDPVTNALGQPWHEPGEGVYRIAIGPDGSLLLATDRNWNDLQYSNYWRGGGFVHVTGNLEQVTRRVEREEDWGVVDVAFATDGALCVTGRGASAAVLFHERPTYFYEGHAVYTGYEPFVARLPESGVRPPSRVRVTSRGPSDVSLAWPTDGDAVDHFEVERSLGYGYGWYPIPTYERIRRVPRSAHAIRLRELASGGTHRLRLVAVFASGVRTGVDVPIVKTPPAPIRWIRAQTNSTGGVTVEWSCHGYGDRTGFELERSVGSGPFESVYDTSFAQCGNSDFFVDRARSVPDGWLTYRIRAVTRSPHAETPWRYSLPILAR